MNEKVFGAYARYYDLLYQGKDYAAETQYVLELLRRHAPNAGSILELGCGSGHHARHFAEAGYELIGVDLSKNMLEKAESLRSELPTEIAQRLSFSLGDLRHADLGRRFDAIVALFHVMSYQTTYEDLRSTFSNIRKHLQPGGICIFDCWYGPGVLSDPPQVRIRRLENEHVSLLRIAEPEWNTLTNRVEVGYTIQITDKESGLTQEVREKHLMRYFFQTEVEMLAASADLEFVENLAWRTLAPPTTADWNSVFVLRG